MAPPKRPCFCDTCTADADYVMVCQSTLRRHYGKTDKRVCEERRKQYLMSNGITQGMYLKYTVNTTYT